MAMGIALKQFMVVSLNPTEETAKAIDERAAMGAIGNMDACHYHEYKSIALKAVLESHARLARNYDRIIVEGAGSPAEINLRANDIANMGFAEMVDCPVILIADIDRGGVFAHLAGTLALLSDSEQARIKGFVINRFRGDIALLQSGLDWLEEYTGKPVLGVLPYLHGLHLEAEDAVPYSPEKIKPSGTPHIINIIIPVLPRISNHTDFDPLRLHPQVNLQFIRLGEAIPPADLIILPGSKSVRADLELIRQNGWENAIKKHLRYGGKIIGICGGFQMLGQWIHDSDGLEGEAGSCTGMGLFDMSTTLAPDKQLSNIQGTLTLNGVTVTGYEIHMGVTTFHSPYTSAVSLPHRLDGAMSKDGLILGTYIHGLFESPAACTTLLSWAGLIDTQQFDYQHLNETSINRLADTIEHHMNTELLYNLLNLEIGQS